LRKALGGQVTITNRQQGSDELRGALAGQKMGDKGKKEKKNPPKSAKILMEKKKKDR